VVKLKKFQGTLENYADQLRSGIGTTLSAHGESDWKSFPRIIVALDAEDRRLKSLGLKPGYRATTFDTEFFDEADRAFLRKFEK
jgi:hypothetical protein